MPLKEGSGAHVPQLQAALLQDKRIAQKKLPDPPVVCQDEVPRGNPFAGARADGAEPKEDVPHEPAAIWRRRPKRHPSFVVVRKVLPQPHNGARLREREPKVEVMPASM